jgi:galactoside O-acetyltransferase
MKAISFLMRSLRQWVIGRRQRYRAYAIHGIWVPAESEIAQAEAIKIGARFSLGRQCKLYCQDPENGSQLVIGDRVALNDNVMINADCGGKITIGNDVLIGPNTVIRAADHRFSDFGRPIVEQGHIGGSIDIGDDVWIGANAVILPNVRIGRGTVIGAGSVVNADVPDYSVAVGVPARVVKSRVPNDIAS